jgi:Xaa-Pro dipeptidase
MAGAALLGNSTAYAQSTQPEPIRRLRRMTDNVVPITSDERKSRIEKAQKLMRDQRIDAIYIEPGSSMFYYTGMRWGTSERMFALVIPARGEIAWVCPKFEEERARELIKMGTDIRTWEEDESPYQRVAEIFKDEYGSFSTTGFVSQRRRQ